MTTLPHQRDGFGSADALFCPDCGHDCLHHGRVEVFDRRQDNDQVDVAVIDGGQARVERAPNASSGNPSLRRHGLRIFFWCERCSGVGADKVLCIEQHKGNTFLSWGPSPSLDDIRALVASPS